MTHRLGDANDQHAPGPHDRLFPGIARRQLDADTARTIDALIAEWAEDAQYDEFPSALLAERRAAIRDRHSARFKQAGLFGRLISRIAVRDLMVDQDSVTRSFEGRPAMVAVVAIYQISDGRIAATWFRLGEPAPDPPG